MGHADIKTTARYLTTSMEDLENAVETIADIDD